jgi:CSLREA domain-containing protein
MKKILLGLIAVAVMTFGTGTLTATASHGQTFVKTFEVTKQQDTNDGKCDSDCSLREAIVAANASPGYDRVWVNVQYVSLDLSGSGNLGDLDITDKAWVAGNGIKETVVSMSQDFNDRVFHVHPGVEATIRGMYIAGGGSNHTSIIGNGGVILKEGKLLVWRANIAGGGAAKGGGLYNSGTLTLKNSNVHGNYAREAGGGLYNAKQALLDRTEFHSNESFGIGGGLSNYGTVTLKTSRFTHNIAASGDPDINPRGKIR